MIKRIIPSVMATVADEHTPVVAKANAETARVQNLDPNLCPICSSHLVARMTNGIPVKVCLHHNIVMPAKDET